MEKKSQVAMIIVGAAAGYALYKFYSMPKEERDELVTTIKDKTRNLLEDAGNTVEKVEHYVAEIKTKGKEQWMDKLLLVKKMFSDLYITDQNLISKVQ
ncbi:MAG: hypothetical protein ABIO04_08255 [Ferruginibacter sp.]